MSRPTSVCVLLPLVAAITLTLVGCPDVPIEEEPDYEPTQGSVSEENFIAEFATALCARLAECSPQEFDREWESAGDCQNDGDAILACYGDCTFDGQAGAACLDEIASSSCRSVDRAFDEGDYGACEEAYSCTDMGTYAAETCVGLVTIDF